MKDLYNKYLGYINPTEVIRKRPEWIWITRAAYYSSYVHYLNEPKDPEPKSAFGGGLSYDDLFGSSNFITISYDIPGQPSPTSFNSINQMAESILSHLGLGPRRPATPAAKEIAPPSPPPDLPFRRFEKPPTSIEDLIALGESYETLAAERVRWPLDIERLKKLTGPLRDLQSLIGMSKAKEAVFNQVIYQLQNLRNPKGDFLHTVIDGEPGVGKTELARILGRIFAATGAVSKGTFTEVSITDLKGSYVGQSEMKTTKKLNEALGGVVYFDEAYSLGSSHMGGGATAGMDTYSEGIINIINRYMSEHVDDLIMIFSGYRADMKDKFFSGNRGLESRIGIWISIDKYEAADLASIFAKKVRDQSWTCDVTRDALEVFFRTHRERFRFNGRDIEIFLTQVKTAHARRMLNCDPDQHRHITHDDLTVAMTNWQGLRKQEDASPSHSMYI
jgi:SpoVK/Ycf46/Vps4 family AAA+-type ATPase